LKFVHTADTHLGFEYTRTAQGDPKGRVNRAEAVFRNFLEVIRHAVEIQADFFIHSGDLFNKAYISRETLDRLTLPFAELKKEGIRVLLVPGNHERSEFPFDLFHGYRNVVVFDSPKSICLDLHGYSVGVAGFPFIRENSRGMFLNALRETEYETLKSDFNILVTHQAFDRATVGPGDFVFREGRGDTVSRATVPTDFEYIAAGHIHRHQILPHPLKPGLNFVYPGSTQRVSFAERFEEKGFMEGELLHDRIETRFIPLPSYEMESIEVHAAGLTARECEDEISSQFWRFEENRVIRFDLTGGTKGSDYPAMDFGRIRRGMPPVLECQFMIHVGKRRIAK
jgi:DNA repair protein SbcD/Mre11